MSTTFEIITAARALAMRGESGFDDDAGMDGWLAELDALATVGEDKMLACTVVVDDAKVQAERLRELAKRIGERAKAYDAIVERVEGKMLSIAQGLHAVDGRTKFNLGDGGSVSLVTRKDLKVEVTDVLALPFKFQKVAEPKADLAGIKAAAKLGEKITGATVTEVQETHLRRGK